YATGSPGTRGVYVGDLGGAEPRRLLDADTAAVFASSEQLLFLRQGTLFAQHFDPVRLDLIGAPLAIHERVPFDRSLSSAPLSSSAAGPVVYRVGSGAGQQRQFVWFERSGREIASVGEPDAAGPLDPSLSPDEHLVALSRVTEGKPDIWLLETARGVLSRFS